MTAVNYPELDELDAAFRAVLAADPAPLTTMAMLWHEAIAMERDPAAPAARTRSCSRWRWNTQPDTAANSSSTATTVR